MRHTTSINVGLPLPTPSKHRKRANAAYLAPIRSRPPRVVANNAPPAPIRSGLERPQIPQRSPTTSALVERLPAKNTNINT